MKLLDEITGSHAERGNGRRKAHELKNEFVGFSSSNRTIIFSRTVWDAMLIDVRASAAGLMSLRLLERREAGVTLLTSKPVDYLEGLPELTIGTAQMG